MKREVVIISLLLFFLSVFAFADVKLPSPTELINDFAGILTNQEKQNLLSVSKKIKQETGAELAVAIVKTTSPLDTKLYAVKLFEKWGIGEKGKDNGVLILLAMEEKRIEIEVGYGLEGILPDGLAGEILDNYAVPNFKKGEFGEGLYSTAVAISEVIITKGEVTPVKKESQTTEGLSLALILVIIGVVILGIFLKKGGSIVLGIFGAVVGYSSGAIIGAIIGAMLGMFFGWLGLFRGGRFGGGGRLGGGFGGGSGGFGGFGGGRSGGGGAGRGW
jgi:uncharacterized protein